MVRNVKKVSDEEAYEFFISEPTLRQFGGQYRDTRDVRSRRPTFSSVFNAKLAAEKMTREKFCELADLSLTTCRKIRNGEGGVTLEIAVKACIALNIRGEEAKYWLSLAGYILNTTPLQVAYESLLYSDWSLFKCNDILIHLNFCPLVAKSV
jgi:hypothetical protein